MLSSPSAERAEAASFTVVHQWLKLVQHEKDDTKSIILETVCQRQLVGH